MQRPGRILVVDDNPRWREQVSESLEQAGFQVDTAATSDDAFARLAAQLYHVLILDIRMKDTDALNVEGMTTLEQLKKRNLSDVLDVIMLSAHGTREQMRTAFRDHKVADFVSKSQFNAEELIDKIHKLLSGKEVMNLALETHWQNPGGLAQAVAGVEFDGQRVRKNTPELADRAADELDDLLCRLFADASSLLVSPLAAGRSGASVLRAVPFFDSSGGAQATVVKFGTAQTIATEYTHYKQYVAPFVGGARATAAQRVCYTPRLGGIRYSFLGANAEQLEDFGTFLRHADLAQITAVLDSLFFQTCANWYANPGRLQPLDLTSEYQSMLGFTHEKLEQALAEQLRSVQGKQRLQFRSLQANREFVNPIAAIEHHHLVRSTYLCTTHGDFNEGNILIDNAGNAWLIDFYRTGPGHILRDVVQLDTVVRIQLLPPEAATLDERLAMEDALDKASRYSQLDELARHTPSENPAVARAYAVSIHLRKIARRLTQQNPSDDMSEFSVAALYQALNMLRFYWLPVPQREHALMSAALLAARLEL